MRAHVLMGTSLLCFVGMGAIAPAQDRPATATTTTTAAAPAAPVADPYTSYSKFMYKALGTIFVVAAEKVPEESYAFKPTESVRTLGQIVGHVADAQYGFCSSALGEKNPAPGIEKSKTSKADLVASLKSAIAYCNRAFDGMTDASGAQTVNFHGRETPRLGVLIANSVHTTEHYGNLVTYMRMKNIVPPTSDPEIMKMFAR